MKTSDKFLYYLKGRGGNRDRDRSRSEATARAYASDLDDFLSWADGRAFTSETVNEYRAELQRRKLAGATIDRRMAALAAYGRWRGKEDVLKQINRTGSRSDSQWLTTADERELVAAAKARIETAHGTARSKLRHRDYAVFLLMLKTGLTVSETAALTPSDVHLADKTLEVNGRQVPIPDNLVEALDRWMALNASEQWLFPGRPKKKGDEVPHLSERQLQSVVRKIAQDAHLGRSVSPSVLRNTYAVRLHESDMKVEDIAARLGIHPSSLSARLPRKRSEAGNDGLLMQYVPEEITDHFEPFVGNQRAVRQLCRYLARIVKGAPAKARSMCFTGPSGTGKTMLAKLTAQALGLPLIAPKRAFTDAEELFRRMMDVAAAQGDLRTIEPIEDGRKAIKVLPPMVVFMDEVHLLRRRLETLLTILESDDRTGETADYSLRAPDVVWLAATTDPERLPDPFLQRFHVIPLREYTLEEVAQIVKNEMPGFPDELYRRLARMGRLQPRDAKRRAHQFYDDFQLIPEAERDRLTDHPDELSKVTNRVLDELADDWGIDEDGISRQDRIYMGEILRAKRPLGLDTLASRLRVSPAHLEKHVEPYLLRLRLLELTERGRQLSEAGIANQKRWEAVAQRR